MNVPWVTETVLWDTSLDRCLVTNALHQEVSGATSKRLSVEKSEPCKLSGILQRDGR